MRWLQAVMIVMAWWCIGATCVDQGPVDRAAPDPAGAETDEPTDDEEELPASTGNQSFDAGAIDSGSRATLTSGLELTALRSEIIRQDGSIEDVGDEELFLYPGNRARIFIGVANSADGYAPINFELCTDNHEAVTIIDAEAVEGIDGGPSSDYPEDSELAPQPCRVRFPPGEWPIIERGDEVEFLTGAILTLDQPAGGYLTIRFRAEFEALGEMDLYEYTVPYRVMPSGQSKAWFTPRRAVLRRLVVDLP